MQFTRLPGVDFGPCRSPGIAWLAGAARHVGKRRRSGGVREFGETCRECDLHKRRVAAVPRGVGNSLAVYAERAQNSELWDVEGRRYVDFASGIAVVNTGHVHPAVKAAMAAQLDKITHGCFQVTPVRELHRARRSTECTRTRIDAEENHLPHHRRRSRRERDQDRALRDEAFSGHRFHGRLSRPHARVHRTHGQGAALQGGLRADAAGSFSCALPHAVPWREQ